MPSVLLSFVRGTIASQPVPPQASQLFFQNPFAQYQPNHIGNRIDYSAVKPNQ